MATNNRKLKILCLHGYRQSETKFRERTGGFRKAMKKHADFVFIEALHSVGEEQRGDDSEVCLGWWFSREDDYYRAVEFSDLAKGYDETIEHIQKIFVEQGPFDGVLAFSQGACLLTQLTFMMEAKELDIEFKFTMLFAAFKSRCSLHDNIYSEHPPITTPALLCIGRGDEIIPLEMGDEVKQYYDPSNTTVVYHEGGHFMPVQAEQKAIYKEFLQKQLDAQMTLI